MGYADQDFWGALKQGAPGLLNAGLNYVGNRMAGSDAANRLNTAQGPDYQAAMAGSRTALANAGSLDPNAAGSQWLANQRGLLAPGDSADEAALLRQLNATGMLGAASYGVQGPGAASGVAQNPLAAAYYAQRAKRDATMAANAQQYGQGMIDTQLQRSRALQDQANAGRSSTLNAGKTVPSAGAANALLLKGLGGVISNTGLLGKGVDWLKNIFGGGNDYNADWYMG